MNPKTSVSIRAKDRIIGKELEHIVLAAEGFRFSGPKERPDLLIFELSEKFDEEFKMIASLIESNAVGGVFVTAREQDANLVLKAMRAGAKEFFPQPIDEMEVKAALTAFKKRSQQSLATEPACNGQVIHVMGAKGGVGTTTVAVNLAMILAELKQAGSVALVDLNTVFGEIPLFLSLDPTYHWGQITKNVHRLDSTFLLNAMTRHASGVHILPSPNHLNGHPPATAEIMGRLFSAMKNTFDYIVVDGGQALDGPALKGIEMSDHIVMITLLSLPCLRNTNNVLKSLNGLGTISKERIRLVVNRHMKNSDITIKDAEESVRNEFFWNIPNDYKTTMSAINRGIPIHGVSSKAEITRSLAGMADALIAGGKNKPKKKGWSLFKRR